MSKTTSIILRIAAVLLGAWCIFYAGITIFTVTSYVAAVALTVLAVAAVFYLTRTKVNRNV